MAGLSPIIQVAGVHDLKEAEMIIKAGATHVGFPLGLDVHKQDITDDQAAEIIQSLSNPSRAVLITYLDKAEDIVNMIIKLGCSTVQIHGRIPMAELILLRETLPGLKIWKSLVIQPGNFIPLSRQVKVLEGHVDAFITDTYDPLTGASGATGKTHDWKISKKLVELSRRPVILAGGLNLKNIKEAILDVKPSGVDAHTGLEGWDGRKDQKKVEFFVQMAMDAFETINED
jgi:phosphoribosylanthranilate isomerase